jgi:nitrogenase molybdenum-iron protein beta chain
MSNEVKSDQKFESKTKSNNTPLEGPRFTCALGSAIGTVLAIDRAVPILHAGSGCGFANLFGYQYAAGIQGVGYVGGCATPSCNLSQDEVVFGGENRLKEQIENTFEIIDGDLYVVLNGCVPGLIGDDVQSVVNEVKSKSDYPLVHADTSGFKGDSYFGYDKTLLAIIEQLLPEKATTKKGLVNIFGVVPYQNIFWKGDLLEIKRLLNKLGLEVNVIFGDPEGGLEALNRIPAAEFNILFSPWVGKEVVEKLKEKYDTPYLLFSHLPIGGQDTAKFLNSVSEKLDVSAETLESVIQEEARDFYDDVDNASDFMIFAFPTLPFAVVGDTTYAVGHTRFLANELGFIPSLVIITDNPPEEVRPVIEQSLDDLDSPFKPKVVYEQDSYNIRHLVDKEQIAVLLASSKEKHYALDKGLLYLSISFPAFDRVILRRTYTGYKGGTTFIEDLSALCAGPF